MHAQYGIDQVLPKKVDKGILDRSFLPPIDRRTALTIKFR